MSPTIISRNYDDLTRSVNAASQAQTGTQDARSTTTSASRQTATEIQEATEALSSRFAGLAAALRSQISQFNTTVATSDWDGAMKEQARVTADQLRTQLDALTASTNEQIDAFGTWMLNQAEGFSQDVGTTLANLLDEYGQRYESLGQVMTTYNEQIQDLDRQGAASMA